MSFLPFIKTKWINFFYLRRLDIYICQNCLKFDQLKMNFFFRPFFKSVKARGMMLRCLLNKENIYLLNSSHINLSSEELRLYLIFLILKNIFKFNLTQGCIFYKFPPEFFQSFPKTLPHGYFSFFTIVKFGEGFQRGGEVFQTISRIYTLAFLQILSFRNQF